MRAFSAKPSAIDMPVAEAAGATPRRRECDARGGRRECRRSCRTVESSASREEALVREERVEREAAVPLAQDEAVAFRPARVAGVEPQHVVVQHAQDLDERKRGADVAALAGFERADDRPAQRQRPGVEADRHRIGHVRTGTGCRRIRGRLERSSPAPLQAVPAAARHPAWEKRSGKKSLTRISAHFKPNRDTPGARARRAPAARRKRPATWSAKRRFSASPSAIAGWRR